MLDLYLFCVLPLRAGPRYFCYFSYFSLIQFFSWQNFMVAFFSCFFLFFLVLFFVVVVMVPFFIHFVVRMYQHAVSLAQIKTIRTTTTTTKIIHLVETKIEIYLLAFSVYIEKRYNYCYLLSRLIEVKLKSLSTPTTHRVDHTPNSISSIKHTVFGKLILSVLK